MCGSYVGVCVHHEGLRAGLPAGECGSRSCWVPSVYSRCGRRGLGVEDGADEDIDARTGVGFLASVPASGWAAIGVLRVGGRGGRDAAEGGSAGGGVACGADVSGRAHHGSDW